MIKFAVRIAVLVQIEDFVIPVCRIVEPSRLVAVDKNRIAAPSAPHRVPGLRWFLSHVEGLGEIGVPVTTFLGGRPRERPIIADDRDGSIIPDGEECVGSGVPIEIVVSPTQHRVTRPIVFQARDLAQHHVVKRLGGLGWSWRFFFRPRKIPRRAGPGEHPVEGQ